VFKARVRATKSVSSSWHDMDNISNNKQRITVGSPHRKREDCEVCIASLFADCD